MGIDPLDRLRDALAKAKGKLQSRPMATEKNKGEQASAAGPDSQEQILQDRSNGEQEQLARGTLESLQDDLRKGAAPNQDGFLAGLAKAHRKAKASSKNSGEAKPRVGGESPRIALSVPMLLALSLVLVCAVAWAFFMGLMVGRGQNPQESLPTMASIVSPNGADFPKDAAEDVDNGVSTGQIPPAKNAESLPPASQGPSGALPVPTPAAGVHAPPTGAATAAWPDASGMRPKPAPVPKPAAPRPNLNDRQIYDFVYQAAAFKSNADALKIQKALNDKNIRSTVRRSGKVYLLLVNFRGNVAQAEKMIGSMRSVGLGKPMQLSRTAVENKPTKRKK